MQKTKRRLTPREQFERTLKKKLEKHRPGASLKAINNMRTENIKFYEIARKKTDIIIKSAEAVARKVKKEKLHDTQIILVGRASRPLFATLRQASDKLGLKKENIKLLEIDMFGARDFYKRDSLSRKFVDYAGRIGIGIGKKPKPVIIIDAGAIWGGTSANIAKVLRKENPNLKAEALVFGSKENKMVLEPPTRDSLSEGTLMSVSEPWPHPVQPVSEYTGEGKKAKPVYKEQFWGFQLGSWIWEQARQHRVKEWLKSKI